MMVVDGATSPGVYFWCQTVPVLPNTDYYFEFYVASAYPASPAEVGALFNGVLLGSAFATSTTCEWIQYSTVWNSGGATSVTICLEDLNIIGFGNDFLVDDVFLREICKYEEEVTITVLDEIVESQSYQICEGEVIEVGGQSFQNGGQYEISLSSWQGCDSTLMVDIEVITVEAYIEPPAAISCLFPESALDGSLSWGSYGIDSYLWTTFNGLILSNPTQNSVSVGAGGTYQLLVSTNTGGLICWDSITVDVPVDTLSPDFTILTPDPLSCQDSILDLEAILNNLPMGGSLDWTTQDGFILNGQSTLKPTVKGLGTYTLTVTNPENGCTASKSVEVIGDTLRPVINLEAIPEITCRDSQVILSVQVVSPATGWLGQWTTGNGLILSKEDSLQILAGQAGLYTFTLIDTLTKCISTIDAQVTENILFPALSLIPLDTLGCGEDTLLVSLDIQPDSLNYTIQWGSPNGMILSGQNGKTPVFGSTGTYQVLVENAANGCRDSAQITIIRYEDLPDALAGPDLIIDCSQDSVQPQSLGSEQGTDIVYLWTQNGVTVDTILQPWFDQAGTYVLQVTDTISRCIALDTLLVTDIRAIPQISLAAPGILNCLNTEEILDATGSDFGNHTALWSGPGLISGASTLTPEANLPGWYVLTLTDTTNHCVAIDSILLTQDIAPPTAVIAPADSLDCNNPQISLNGGGSGPSGILNYQWTTQTGNIVNGANTAIPQVSGGGWYTLTLTRTDNGCTAQDSVLVYQDPNLPTVSIAPADTLTCDQTTIQLTGSYQSPGTNLSFQWTTTNGQITGGGSSLVATINQPGTYTFTLLDNDTGCEAVDEIEVVNNLTVPAGMIAPPDPLTCMDTIRIITLETNETVLPLWRIINGQIIGGLDQMSMQTATPGQYEVVWTNPQNGCKDSLVITLGEDKQLPTADAGPDALLPCEPPTMLLDGTSSSGQGPLSYVWSALQGQLATTGNPGEAEVSSIGSYLLVVTDTENGCTAMDTVTITQLVPMGLDFDLSPPGCKRAEGELSLLGSQGGQPPYLFEVDGSSYTQGTSLLLPPGTWPVSVVDDLGCRFDTVVTMPDRADLMLEAPPEVWIVYGDSGRIELKSNFPSTAIDSVRWEPALWLTPTADKLVWYSHATLAMQYQVWIRTEDGCEAKGLIQILIDNDPKVYVPNVFSPSDGNGVNDRFYPHSKPGKVQKIQSMTIYDRWGNQVFRQDDFAPDDAASGWDGTHRGRLMQPAVLVWVMEVVLNTGEIVLLKGDVTIK
jgi:hypothetical protein